MIFLYDVKFKIQGKNRVEYENMKLMKGDENGMMLLLRRIAQAKSLYCLCVSVAKFTLF